jgi:UDP-N-acetylglucosamine--N-acetylmuramyl-(pentapeptide) pyrophosphoryl-undecaprenol N-acetylglucosamine transferase
MLRPIAIAAGGTGGHLFPAEALAGELARRGERPVLFTDARTAAHLGPGFAGVERHVVRAEGVAGRGLARLPGALVALARGVVETRGLLARLAPATVVAFGGYPSIPPVLAARLLPRRRRPRVVLHEQNAVLGRANRSLARFADLLALSTKATARIPAGARIRVLGNPVRAEIAALAGNRYPIPAPDAALHLLVLGGSLGARALADLVPTAVAALPNGLRTRLRLTMQCRTEDLDRARAALEGSGVSARLAPFFDDVAALYTRAHLVIARAGASTVAELACAGRPSLLIPLPHAIDDHQTANARALADAGAAELHPQATLTPAGLAARLAALLAEPLLLARMAESAAALAEPHAAARLADAVLALAPTEVP